MSRIIDCSDEAQLRGMSASATGELARIDWGPLVGTMSHDDLQQVTQLGPSWDREVAFRELARREAVAR
jgi:hypothetical protein